MWLNNDKKQILALLPASLLCRFISVLASPCECLGWFFSRSRTSTNPCANLYPYSTLSPHPPQIQSRWSCLGRPLLEQPHVESWPSRQARLILCTTPAVDTACVKAASLEAANTMEIVLILWMCHPAGWSTHIFWAAPLFTPVIMEWHWSSFQVTAHSLGGNRPSPTQPILSLYWYIINAAFHNWHIIVWRGRRICQWVYELLIDYRRRLNYPWINL